MVMAFYLHVHGGSRRLHFPGCVLYSRSETDRDSDRRVEQTNLEVVIVSEYPSSHPFRLPLIIHMIWRLWSEKAKGGIAFGSEMMSLITGMVWPDLECDRRMSMTFI
jgi:hypothetical protein